MCGRLIFVGLLLLALNAFSVRSVQAQNYNLNLCCFAGKGLVSTADGLAPGSGDKDINLLASGVCQGTTRDDGSCDGTISQVTGAFSCTNHGQNFGYGTTSGPVYVDLEGLQVLTSVKKNGRFRDQTVTATVPEGADNSLCAQWGFDWQLYDFAFCGPEAFQVTGTLQIDGSTVVGAHVVCNIHDDPDGSQINCDQLSEVKKLGVFTGPEYTCRLCPADGSGGWDCDTCLTDPSQCALVE
jgi:hypothetical protein